jgi:hypothetical protein
MIFTAKNDSEGHRCNVNGINNDVGRDQFNIYAPNHTSAQQNNGAATFA